MGSLSLSGGCSPAPLKKYPGEISEAQDWKFFTGQEGKQFIFRLKNRRKAGEDGCRRCPCWTKPPERALFICSGPDSGPQISSMEGPARSTPTALLCPADSMTDGEAGPDTFPPAWRQVKRFRVRQKLAPLLSASGKFRDFAQGNDLSLIHISEPTRPY